MTKAELQKSANSVFDRYKKVDKVYITTDGQAFFEESHAKNHATAKDLDVESFRRKNADTNDFDLDSMDRLQLDAFIKENKLEVVFYADTPDEALRTMIVNAIAAIKTVKKTTKKAK